eukprot:scaffold29822_cov63-Phaeocystis_antarctica.AAC.3
MFIMRNGPPPDVGPPPIRCAPRVDHIGHPSSPDCRSWSWGACRDSEQRSRLSLHVHASARRRSHGDVAPAFISQLQGAAGGLQPGPATGAAGRTSGGERPARTRLCRSPPGGHPAVVVSRGATFRDAERGNLVGT